MMDINEHQDQRYTWGDNNGRDLYLLGVNVLVFLSSTFCFPIFSNVGLNRVFFFIVVMSIRIQ